MDVFYLDEFSELLLGQKNDFLCIYSLLTLFKLVLLCLNFPKLYFFLIWSTYLLSFSNFYSSINAFLLLVKDSVEFVIERVFLSFKYHIWFLFYSWFYSLTGYFLFRVNLVFFFCFVSYLIVLKLLKFVWLKNIRKSLDGLMNSFLFWERFIFLSLESFCYFIGRTFCRLLLSFLSVSYLIAKKLFFSISI